MNKFRVYDKKKEKMYYPEDDKKFYRGMDGQVIPYAGNSELDMLRAEPDRFIDMDWVGLKDKNGDEIYEGDIIECDVTLADKKMVTVVEWNSCGFTANGILSNAIKNGGKKTAEILGNKFENPELLNN